MTIEVQCRECGGVLRARDESLGKTLPCPKCSHPLVVEGKPSASRGGGGGAVPIVLSLLAVALSVFAACWSYFRDPLGKGLKGYDFSTPEASVRSETQVQVNQDIRAIFEFNALRSQKRNNEFLDSVEVHKTMDFDRSDEESITRDREYDSTWKVVFLTYKNDGKTIHRHRFYRRHKQTGRWFQAYSSNFAAKGELRQAIDEWNRKNFGGVARGPIFKPPPTKTAPRGK